MNGLTLTLRSAPDCELNACQLGGDRLWGDAGRPADPDDIRRWKLPILGGHHSLTLGDCFTVAPGSAGRVVIEGDLSRFHGLAGDWRQGELVIDGDVGDGFCSAMTGGVVSLRGSARTGACRELRGGSVHITGNVGDDLGGPLLGRRSGMRGGSVLVNGDAGQFAGYRLRRGTLIILGDCGESIGCDLVAGTLLVGGRAAGHVAPGMRRGTIFLGSGGKISPLRFTAPETASLGIAKLIANSLPPEAAAIAESLRGTLRRQLGDVTAGGMGEIWHSPHGN
ncbi:MAG: formylmethanofuran dehydrogenase subunit C [Planctomycetaceae bacterium]|nr:MAG: formylmethanofuran dehydrogenase subunit C [Planctomycetaceae bacterium]